MSRLRPADLGAGAAGIALLAVLFLPWYGTHVGTLRIQGAAGPSRVVEFGPLRDYSAWQAFSVVDVLLALLALLAIAVPLVTVTARGPAKPVAVAVLSTVGSSLTVLLVLWRLVDAPGDGLGVRYGAWLGLAAALLMFAASFAAMHDERTPGAVPPDVPRRPAPA